MGKEMVSEDIADGDRIRIAVALVALRFKPPNQSFEGYTLDLRAMFAPSKSSQRFEEQASDNSWRARALLLENSLSELQVKFDTEHTKVLELTAKVAGDNTIPTPDPPAAASSSKKKGKKKSESSNRSDLVAILGRLGNSRLPAPIRPTSPLLTIFTDLDQLVSILPSPVSPEDSQVLFSVTKRALETIATTLGLHLTQKIAPQDCSKTPPDLDSLQTLGLLLVYVVESVLPLLSGTHLPYVVLSDEYNGVVNILMRTILHPIIQSFAPLSYAFLHLCFTHPKTIGPKSDMRQDLLSLLRSIHHSVGRLKYKPSCIPESLALEAVCELKKLYLDNSGTSDATTTTHDGDYINVDDGNDSPFNLTLNPDMTSIGGTDLVDGTSHQGCAPNSDRDVSQGGLDDKQLRTGKRTSIVNVSAIDHVKEARVARLAKKDSLWFLCSVLHTVFGPTRATTEVSSVAASSSASTSNVESPIFGTGTSSTSSTNTTSKNIQDTMHERVFTGLCELIRSSGDAEWDQYHKQRSSCLSVGQSTSEWNPGAGKGQMPAGSQCGKSFSGVGEKAGVDPRENTLGLVHEETERRKDVIVGGGRDDEQVIALEGRGADERRVVMPYRGTRHQIDKVARGMLLAVVERYWLWTSENYSA